MRYPSLLDLAVVVSGIIRDVDCETPSPYMATVPLFAHEAAYLTPDRRASAAVLVDLRVSARGDVVGSVPWLSTLDVMVGGTSLVEGALPLAAILGAEVPRLSAPVVQSPSTPLVVTRRPTAAGLTTNALPLTATWLPCSSAAAASVSACLGRQRWWSLSAAGLAANAPGSLNVERGGRALYAAGYAAPVEPTQGGPLAVSGHWWALRDGRALLERGAMGDAELPVAGELVFPFPVPLPALAHDVRRGSLYRAQSSPLDGGDLRAGLWFSGVETEAFHG